MADPDPELVEKVRTILCEQLNRCCEATACDICVKRARAAIAVCFEDAAKQGQSGVESFFGPVVGPEHAKAAAEFVAKGIRRRGGIE